MPVLEVTANLTVDATYNGKILVVTSAGVTISPNFALMGAGFECEIVTSGSGTVTWGGGVTATNGGTGLPVGAYAKFMAFTSSAGNVVLASVGTASGGGVVAARHDKRPDARRDHVNHAGVHLDRAIERRRGQLLPGPIPGHRGRIVDRGAGHQRAPARRCPGWHRAPSTMFRWRRGTRPA